MASRSEKYIARVLLHEGGYVNHPSDPGGATNYGITQAVARENGYTGDMRSLPQFLAIEIYRRKYWNSIKGDEMAPAIAFQVLDAAVNHGVSRAIKWIQEVVGVQADGILGPKSLSAIRFANPCDAVFRFNAKRIDFYRSLGTFSTFGKGWMGRVSQNLNYAAEDLK